MTGTSKQGQITEKLGIKWTGQGLDYGINIFKINVSFANLRQRRCLKYVDLENLATDSRLLESII